jgi:glycosyltransferase involved in cell wall biosynthesis
MAEQRARIVVVRGHQATPWELRSWELLPPRFDVRFLLTGSNAYDVGDVALEPVPARTLRDFLPRGRVGDIAAHAAGDRYLGLAARLGDADVVHAEELSYWFAAEAARTKRKLGYKLALTVWETLPLGEGFRNPVARRARRLVLAQTDLFLAVTERARDALLLEGVPEERIVVSPPGIDIARFRGTEQTTPEQHLLVSVGRLVWEKGHQDAIRALAAIRQGLVDAPQGGARLRIVGSGPERARLEAHAKELGVADWIEFAAAGYEEMPQVYAEASCLLLLSLPAAGCSLTPIGMPRCFWEEQFGMVLVEAMAAGLPIVASESGAIREVTRGSAAFVAPGDWRGLAETLVKSVLARPPGERAAYDESLVGLYSRESAAERLASAYDRLIDLDGQAQ